MAVSRRARNTFRFLQSMEGFAANDLKALSDQYRRSGNWTEWHRVEGARDSMREAMQGLRGSRSFVDPSRARAEHLQAQQRTAQDVLDIVHELAEHSPDRRLRAMFSHYDADMQPVAIGRGQQPQRGMAMGQDMRGGGDMAMTQDREAPVYTFGLMLREFADKLPQRAAAMDRDYGGVHTTMEDMADRIMNQAMLVNPRAGQSRFAAGSSRDSMERELEEQLARDIPGAGGPRPRDPQQMQPSRLEAFSGPQPELERPMAPQERRLRQQMSTGQRRQSVGNLRRLSPSQPVPGSEFGSFMGRVMNGLSMLTGPSLADREAEARLRVANPTPRAPVEAAMGNLFGRRRRPGYSASI